MKSWMQKALLFAVLSCSLLAAPTQIKAQNPDFAAQVFFAEPVEGATVTSPVLVQMRARRFLLAGIGEARRDAGYLHITVDAGCVPPGETILANTTHLQLANTTHLQYDVRQMKAVLELAPGKHFLCLQATDHTHAVLDSPGLTHVLEIMVAAEPTPDEVLAYRWLAMAEFYAEHAMLTRDLRSARLK